MNDEVGSLWMEDRCVTFVAVLTHHLTEGTGQAVLSCEEAFL
jgi:hypothetical protein